MAELGPPKRTRVTNELDCGDKRLQRSAGSTMSYILTSLPRHSSANTLVVVRPASAQGSLSLQLQLIAKPTDEERGASKRMSPLYNLHSAHRGHRASVTDAGSSISASAFGPSDG